MANDFQEHLDTARLWWDLDEAVLYAIAGGPSTRVPFRAIALYVIDLKAKADEAGDTDNTAALAKIAIRLAGTPGDIAAPTSTLFPRQRLTRGRLAVITVLAVVALLALITAAAAANMITLPAQVEDVLNKIGIPLHSDRSTQGLKERDPNHAAPIYIEHLSATKVVAPAGVGSAVTASSKEPPHRNANRARAVPASGAVTSQSARTKGHHRDPTPKKHARVDRSERAKRKHGATPKGKAGKGSATRASRPTPKPKKSPGP